MLNELYPVFPLSLWQSIVESHAATFHPSYLRRSRPNLSLKREIRLGSIVELHQMFRETERSNTGIRKNCRNLLDRISYEILEIPTRTSQRNIGDRNERLQISSAHYTFQ